MTTGDVANNICRHSHLNTTEDILIGKYRLAHVLHQNGWIITFAENELAGRLEVLAGTHVCHWSDIPRLDRWPTSLGPELRGGQPGNWPPKIKNNCLLVRYNNKLQSFSPLPENISWLRLHFTIGQCFTQDSCEKHACLLWSSAPLLSMSLP